MRFVVSFLAAKPEDWLECGNCWSVCVITGAPFRLPPRLSKGPKTGSAYVMELNDA
jgi:hypothetical protein